MSDDEYIEAVRQILWQPLNQATVKEAFRLNNMKFKTEHAHWCTGCRQRVYNNLRNYIREKTINPDVIANGL